MIADRMRAMMAMSGASDGLYAWGRNDDGQLGLGDTTTRRVPTKVGTDTWVAVSCGYYHSLGINTDGELYAWGRNNYGQLGLGHTTSRYVPIKVGTDTWIAVTSGYYHSLGIKGVIE